MIIQRKKPATPAQQGRPAIDSFEVDDLLNLKRMAANNHDVTVHGGEMDAAVADQAVMRCLYADINTLVQIGQANGVALIETRRPDTSVEFEGEIWMRAVRFCARRG